MLRRYFGLRLWLQMSRSPVTPATRTANSTCGCFLGSSRCCWPDPWGSCCVVRIGELGHFSQPYYFLLTNIAAFVATLRYLQGERMIHVESG